jgi:hypothetical protein
MQNFKSSSSSTIFISHLFCLSRVRHRFYSSGLFLNFRDVRNIVVSKIGASDVYFKYIARANTNSEARPIEMILSQTNKSELVD